MAGERAGAIDVERELRLLAGSLVLPSPDLVDPVMARIAAEPVPARRSRYAAAAGAAGAWIRTRWRATALVILGAVVAVGAATPVGAAVARWFSFGGVEVVHTPAPPTSTSVAVTPSTAAPGLSLSAATRRVGFTPLVPAGLPRPGPDRRRRRRPSGVHDLVGDRTATRPIPGHAVPAVRQEVLPGHRVRRGRRRPGPVVRRPPRVGLSRPGRNRTAGNRTDRGAHPALDRRPCHAAAGGCRSLDAALDIARTVR